MAYLVNHAFHAYHAYQAHHIVHLQTSRPFAWVALAGSLAWPSDASSVAAACYTDAAAPRSSVHP